MKKIINSTLNTCGGYFYIGNPMSVARIQNFRISESDINGESGFLKEGEVSLTFDSVGWQVFSQYFVNNKGVEIISPYKIKLLTNDFKINNIQYPANTRYPVLIEY